MSDAERSKRKAKLLGQIHQQRIDLSHTTQDWLAVTAPYDRGWQTIVQLRRYLVVAGGVLAVWNLRRPGRLLNLTKRGLNIWSTWRVLSSGLNKLR